MNQETKKEEVRTVSKEEAANWQKEYHREEIIQKVHRIAKKLREEANGIEQLIVNLENKNQYTTVESTVTYVQNRMIWMLANLDLDLLTKELSLYEKIK